MRSRAPARAQCAHLDPRDLRVDELVRAGIARAHVTAPRLLLLDEPTSGVDAREREGIVDLLRGLADSGTAVLTTVGEPLAGPDRMLTLERGQLRGDAAPDPEGVVAMRSRHVEPVG